MNMNAQTLLFKGLGSEIIIFLFSKDALTWSKVTVRQNVT